MVDVYKALTQPSELSTKIKIANPAGSSVNFNTGRPVDSAPFDLGLSKITAKAACGKGVAAFNSWTCWMHSYRR